MVVSKVEDDPFWVGPTVSDAGFVADFDNDDEVYQRCRHRLATELAERFHHLIGLAPGPLGGADDPLPLQAVDCDLTRRTFGRLDGDWADRPLNLRWPTFIDDTIIDLGLAGPVDAAEHEACGHRRNARLVAWKIAVTWRAPSTFGASREIRADDDVYVLSTDGRPRCRIRPDGTATSANRDADLAKSAAEGASLCDLAHAVEELISGRPWTAPERRAALVRRALSAAMPCDDRVPMPPGMHSFSGQAGLIVVADLGTSPPAAAVAEAAETARQEDRPFHVMLPAAADPAHFPGTIWIHDGYRAVRRPRRRTV